MATAFSALSHAPHQPSQNRTIPPAFRNANIYMHRYAFTSALSLALHYVLASLVKGRWIDGKTQTVALLRFTCDMPTLFMLQTLLPSRRRDCHSITPSKTALSHSLFVLQSSVCAYTVLHLNYHISLFVGRGSVCVLVWFCIRAKLRAHTLRHPCLACPSRCTEPLYPHDHCKRTIIHRSHQPFSKPHYPSKIAITLASLVKGEVLSPEKNSGDYRRDCLPLHQPSQNRTIPQKSPPPLPLNERSGSAISQKALSVACYHSLS